VNEKFKEYKNLILFMGKNGKTVSRRSQKMIGNLNMKIKKV
jgi:hypothetical protein